MAQCEKRDHDMKALWAKGLEGKNAKAKDSCAALLTAKELSIVWSNDSRYWKWVSITDPVSCQALDVAELIKVCWLQVDGKYNANNLMKGIKYGVYFCVELKNNLCMNGPVTLKLTRPDGSSEVHTEDLTKKPKNVGIPLKVGEFTNTCTCDQNVKFSLNGADGTTWKTGLTVIGAAIVPIIF